MSESNASPVVGVIMGSDSDLPVMQAAADALKEFEIPHEIRIISAHRTPEEMIVYGKEAAGRGLKVIIAGAGGAAHLPGMVAAITHLPAGIPVATVAVDNARNAGLLAVRILGAGDSKLRERMEAFQHQLRELVLEKDRRVRSGE